MSAPKRAAAVDLTVCRCPDTRPGHFVKPPNLCSRPARHVGDHVSALDPLVDRPGVLLPLMGGASYVRARWSR